jgi:uncharacterized protein (DUF433 family)
MVLRRTLHRRECARRIAKLTATTEQRQKVRELPEDDPRVGVGLYTTSEAARYLGMPVSTLQAWISSRDGNAALVTTVPRKGYEAGIPFIGFAEAFVLQVARRAGAPRNRIRPGVEAVKAELGLAHALASRLLYTDGAELLVQYRTEDENLEVARTHQQQLTSTVRSQLRLITYAGDGYAERLQLPSFGPAEVLVDPAVAFGYPVIKGAGARVKDVLDRFWAGEGLRTIAYDFDLSDEAVEAIVRAQTKPPS